jgi:hypothetical protein
LRKFVRDSSWPDNKIPDTLEDFLTQTRVELIGFLVALQHEIHNLDFTDTKNQPPPPLVLTTTIDLMTQELCIQQEAEARWENLVRTMVPTCLNLDTVFSRMKNMLGATVRDVGGVCQPFAPSLPPHYETSLDSIADDVDRLGRGRPTMGILRRRT